MLRSAVFTAGVPATRQTRWTMMRSMTRWALAGCMALAALSAVAVLDVGSATAEAAPSVSQFAGNWFGPWDLAALDEAGTFDWTISNTGRISGRITGRVWDGSVISGAMVGHVRADGALMFVGFTSSSVPNIKSFPFQGTAVIGDDGKLVVSAVHLANEGPVEHLVIAVLERY